MLKDNSNDLALLTEIIHKYNVKGNIKYEKISERQNITYLLLIEGEFYILRIYSSRYTDQMIIAEHLLLKNLSNYLEVPKPLLNKAGGTLTQIISNNIMYRCSIFNFIRGQTIEDPDENSHLLLSDFINLLYKYMVKIDDELNISFKRPHLTIDNLIINPFKELKKKTDISKSSSLEKLENELLVLWNKVDTSTRLIHGDLHYGNVLKTENGIAFIDFDDCAKGPLLYDIVTLFLPPCSNNNKAVEALLDGLKSSNILTNDSIIQLTYFLALKILEILLKGINDVDRIPEDIIDSYIKKIEKLIILFREGVSIKESIKIIR